MAAAKNDDVIPTSCDDTNSFCTIYPLKFIVIALMLLTFCVLKLRMKKKK